MEEPFKEEEKYDNWRQDNITKQLKNFLEKAWYRLRERIDIGIKSDRDLLKRQRNPQPFIMTASNQAIRQMQ